MAQEIPSEVATKIATSILGLETLEVRNSDRLDFSEVSCVAVKAALQAAFEAGRQFGLTQAGVR